MSEIIPRALLSGDFYTTIWQGKIYRKRMGKYIFTSGQNIYDVAPHIYGSIEGIVDLMMNNAELSLASDLKSGDELIYTDE